MSFLAGLSDDGRSCASDFSTPALLRTEGSAANAAAATLRPCFWNEEAREPLC